MEDKVEKTIEKKRSISIKTVEELLAAQYGIDLSEAMFEWDVRALGAGNLCGYVMGVVVTEVSKG